MLILNAKIEPMDAPTIERGYVLTRGGSIAAVGDMRGAPPIDGEQAVDAGGRLLLPGFVDAHTHLGIFEDSLGFEGDDGNEDTDPCTPQLRALDAINPMEGSFREAREAGVTTVLSSPGSANPVAGQIAAIKTYGRCVDDMIIRAPAGIKMALGENPKLVYHGKNQAPVTRMATAAIIREQLQKAKRYADDLKLAQEDEDTSPPEFDAKCEALLPLLRGEIPAHFHAHRADDIFTAVRIAREFSLRFVIVHGTGGHLIADELAKRGVSVLSGPILSERCKPELHDLTPASPGILHRAGVETAIITDHSVVPIQYLPLLAGLAVREGMDRDAALRAITIVPARICGIDDRVGSVTPGKDADLQLYGTDPLELRAKPDLVIGGGEVLCNRMKG